MPFHQAFIVHTLLFLLSAGLLAQEQSISLLITPDQLVSSLDLTPIYNLDGAKIVLQGKTQKLRVPKGMTFKHLAFLQGWHTADSKIPGYLPVLIDDYDSVNPAIFLDRNGNLDFRDDGGWQALESMDFGEGQRFKAFAVESPDAVTEDPILWIVEKQAEQERLSHLLRFYDSKQELVSNLRKNEAYALSFVMPHQRWGILEDGRQRFRIALSDDNKNGVFGEIAETIMTSKLGVQDRLQRHQEYWLIKDRTMIQLGAQIFEVKEISSVGNQIKVSPVDHKEAGTLLREGNPVPAAPYRNLDNQEDYLLKQCLRSEYTLLYFFGSWCRDCEANVTELKYLDLKYEGRLNVLGLSYNDPIETTVAFRDEERINFDLGLASKTLIEKLNVNQFPFYILADRKGVIVAHGTSPIGVKKILEQ